MRTFVFARTAPTPQEIARCLHGPLQTPMNTLVCARTAPKPKDNKPLVFARTARAASKANENIGFCTDGASTKGKTIGVCTECS